MQFFVCAVYFLRVYVRFYLHFSRFSYKKARAIIEVARENYFKN